MSDATNPNIAAVQQAPAQPPSLNRWLLGILATLLTTAIIGACAIALRSIEGSSEKMDDHGTRLTKLETQFEYVAKSQRTAIEYLLDIKDRLPSRRDRSNTERRRGNDREESRGN